MKIKINESKSRSEKRKEEREREKRRERKPDTNHKKNQQSSDKIGQFHFYYKNNERLFHSIVPIYRFLNTTFD